MICLLGLVSLVLTARKTVTLFEVFDAATTPTQAEQRTRDRLRQRSDGSLHRGAATRCTQETSVL